jgi:hypothetical protein
MWNTFGCSISSQVPVDQADPIGTPGPRTARMRWMISPSPSGTVLDHQRAMQRRSSRRPAGGTEAVIHLPDQRIEGGAGDRPARGGIGRDQRHGSTASASTERHRGHLGFVPHRSA